ncbi:MAG TPA: cellulase family glycosylhydrolase [Pyrinomonadaceae bacterium]|nr:cellulase family glycosylhydrolase [Pyrinomonadaceae bacterium]
MTYRLFFACVFALLAINPLAAQPKPFVTVNGHQLFLNGKPYYFVGTNYWYGTLLGLERDRKRGIERLRKELDLLRRNGVTNLRLMAGAEGSGPLNGVPRVGPPLQPEQGRFDASVLDGLDLILAEMERRQMKAVIFFSNNWEWSGGFQQYLIWNKVIPEKWLTEKPTWDELRDLTSKFYSCTPCKEAYARQVEFVITRTNKITGRRYIDDPTIMAWEHANEPRPMRPSADQHYKKWLSDTAALIKRLDPNHLITTGHEGRIGTESLELFEQIHADPNIDYLTIHIWPKNWAWFESGKMAEGFEDALAKTVEYIDEHVEVAKRLNKPLVIEEFGLPRDGQSFNIRSETTLRDRYFAKVVGYVGKEGIVAGANFWAFGGIARPVKGRLFWKKGDQYSGDPPMEEQGLYSVFDSDDSTWRLLKSLALSKTKAP